MNYNRILKEIKNGLIEKIELTKTNTSKSKIRVDTLEYLISYLNTMKFINKNSNNGNDDSKVLYDFETYVQFSILSLQNARDDDTPPFTGSEENEESLRTLEMVNKKIVRMKYILETGVNILEFMKKQKETK